MEQIKQKTNELISVIKESDIYNKYIMYRDKVSQDKALYDKLNTYKKEQFIMETRRDMGIAINKDEEQRIGNMYTELSINEDVNEMNYYEEALIDVIMNVFEDISSEIDINLDFFDK